MSAGQEPGTGIVMICGAFGVGKDQEKMADDLAALGYVASVPDMFWRTDGGPLTGDEEGQVRAKKRTQPRQEIIENGLKDLAGCMADLKARPECNGKVAVIGFCFGGAYALLGPSRLGFDAGISFHGTALNIWFDDLNNIKCPLAIHWGDNDFAAPPELIEQFRPAVAAMDNAELHVYPGVQHGYMSPGSTEAYNADAAAHSWERARNILAKL